MTWNYPGNLWLIIAVPIIILVASISACRATSELSVIMPELLEWRIRIYLRDLCMAVFLAASILALADPRGPRRPEAAENSGLDIALVMDISRSMLAEDLAPNRLARSIEAVHQIINSLEDVNFSLIIFKGDAQLVVPMTRDKNELEIWLQQLSPSLSTSHGTNIEAAINTALESFPANQARTHLIILFTDGEALSGQVERIAPALSEKNVIVHSFAAGHEEGGVIPLGNGEYVKNKDGYVVITKPDPQSLNRLTQITSGTLNQLIEPGVVVRLIKTIQNERQFIEGRGIQFSRAKQYRLFLLASLFFLLIFFLARVMPWRKKQF